MDVVVLDQADQLLVQRGDDEIGGECGDALPFPRAEERHFGKPGVKDSQERRALLLRQGSHDMAVGALRPI